ncbi:MAG: DUF1501 domain-containing protein, partial [Leadbetterella sp.]
MKRRRFLEIGSLSTTLMLGNIELFAHSKYRLQQLQNAEDNILVIIQLFGGNDALNTIVPADNDTYYSKYRPTTNVSKSNLIKSSDGLYFNKSLAQGTNEGLLGLYKEGKLAVIQGVGYDQPNLSHFRSTDIWLSGIQPKSDADLLSSGWLGRFSDKLQAGTTPDHPTCLNVGNNDSLLFQSEKSNMAISIENPNDFFEQGKTILNGSEFEKGSDAYSDEFNFFMDVSIQSNKYSKV